MEKRLEKHLIVVGNSQAIIIDKSLRKQLGISTKTRLNIMTDGARLLIEPIRDDPSSAVSTQRDSPFPVRRIAALRVYDVLERRGLDDEKFKRLTGHKISPFRTQLDYGINAPSLVSLTLAMDRLDVCIDMLNAGATWEDAIDAALTQVPTDRASTTAPATSVSTRSDP
jgi:virulence-associated protein VagC